MCYQFSLTNVDAQSVINWTAVSQHSWQYVQAPTVSLLFITVIVKLCLQNGFVVRVFFCDSWCLYRVLQNNLYSVTVRNCQLGIIAREGML